MLSPHIESQLDNAWNAFKSAGLSNPLALLEQMSYLLLLRHLAERDEKMAAAARQAGQRYTRVVDGNDNRRWSDVVSHKPDTLQSYLAGKVFPALQGTRIYGPALSAALSTAVFNVPHASMLPKVIRFVDELPLKGLDPDVLGDLYESLLRRLNLSGKNEQYLTPRHISRVLVEMTDPKLGERICDPTAGPGSLLVAAYQWILKAHTPPERVTVDPRGLWHGTTDEALRPSQRKQFVNRIVGFDVDPTMVRLGIVNMLFHGMAEPNYWQRDALAVEEDDNVLGYDLVIANLPSGPQETEFVARSLELLRKRGKRIDRVAQCALVVSENLLANTTDEYCDLRSRLLNDCTLRAVVGLPQGCFYPFSGSKMALMLLEKPGRTESVWFYEVTGDGFTLDDRREPDPARDDLRFVPQAFRIRALGQSEPWESKDAEAAADRQSFVIDRARIEDRDYCLAPNVYRPHTRRSVTQTQTPRQILASIRKLQAKVGNSLDSIERMIEEIGQ